MESKDDGGPAYPGFAGTYGNGMCKPDTSGNGNHESYEAGMTLRDYFACAAMGSVTIGIIANVSAGGKGVEGVLADAAYRMADAMLAARKL